MIHNSTNEVSDRTCNATKRKSLKCIGVRGYSNELVASMQKSIFMNASIETYESPKKTEAFVKVPATLSNHILKREAKSVMIVELMLLRGRHLPSSCSARLQN